MRKIWKWIKETAWLLLLPTAFCVVLVLFTLFLSLLPDCKGEQKATTEQSSTVAVKVDSAELEARHRKLEYKRQERKRIRKLINSDDDYRACYELGFEDGIGIANPEASVDDYSVNRGARKMK